MHIPNPTVVKMAVAAFVSQLKVHDLKYKNKMGDFTKRLHLIEFEPVGIVVGIIRKL